MNVYIIRIWRSQDPQYCSKLMGVLDEFACQEDRGVKRPTPIGTDLKVSPGTRSRRLVFDSMDQLHRILEVVGLTGENDP